MRIIKTAIVCGTAFVGYKVAKKELNKTKEEIKTDFDSAVDKAKTNVKNCASTVRQKFKISKPKNNVAGEKI